ncbi:MULTISPECIES: Gfo/Idh/MocA family protein [Lysobacter]|uniref:Gfo/Idh/MocA family oxidoreductase n=1 Tax=Lysobacter gummosus TaxID=262324 RepID=A0ABY3XJT9_9GAMM|nr:MULTISPECIES: Gfo/Idh/MocA family oxidoreductase [Lysobacter]ALN91558.1 oxidoreductase, NAD-binding Rossmann fold family protein [Lysobacter gummosus]UJB21409.1 Gfo/Idh/MocA family oxidoreductase [Lysobacter capsici]UJQ29474.1 Gfo/Idh/MocA family oxidoreductase [Lysobacter gummosus]UNP31918.1 Gfo/Idh/MocA family oxidoreductase [Lysobacter gummosus]
MTDERNRDATPPFDPLRREFLQRGVGTAAAVGLASVFGSAYAGGSDEIRVGLIGAGGRGTGALRNVLEAAPGVRVVAIGDVFPEQLGKSIAAIEAKLGKPIGVPPERQFSGLDAYKKVIAQDINYVILASPPAFRPEHLKAAIEAGKHVFTEKPIAVDSPGVRQVLALSDIADGKGLKIAAGTQRRHQAGYLDTIKRIHDGAIGEIVAARAYWNQGGLWHVDRKPGWSDGEWMLRNWLYFNWLAGDIIVEQHIHNMDVVNWAMNAHPASAVSLAGRQVRTESVFGNVYDHFATDFEYESGAHMISMCRQMDGCANNISEALVGTRGNSRVDQHVITGANAWKRDSRLAESDIDPYVQEHADLIAAIRGGKPLNELKQVSEATLTAIMGRMAGYSGGRVTWEEALNSQESLAPAPFTLSGSIAVPVVAMPGRTGDKQA